MDRAACSAIQLRDFVSHLVLRVTDQHVVLRDEKHVGDLPLGAERLAGAGGAENEAVGVFEQFPVHHDKVVGQGVDAVVKGFGAGLEQLLGGKGHKDSCAGRGKPPLYLHLIETQGQAAHQPFLRLKVQGHQTAVVLLRGGTGLEHVVVQLLPALRRVHQQERHQEHALIPALEVLQQLLGLLAVGGKV